MLTQTVYISDKYIVIGSEIFSPFLKATTGEVGVKIKSTSFNAL